jgi:hypothetical protein
MRYSNVFQIVLQPIARGLKLCLPVCKSFYELIRSTFIPAHGFILCHYIDLVAFIKGGTWFKDVQIQGVCIQGSEQNCRILEGGS